ncbi:hypothetical protein KSP35_12180 [Aquihabitans sp. G128]|uniref:hypothetical protein n=1 Tax=Aquihabitans sp. G128 TaxID=2849779 RepID=UPI001C24D4DD|nr:hypothetical protein [Aquihabitans sp. G128]QXC59168.1 hypothetical protein KSP35_12180 [Aquihabitans sp. G128]
MPGPRRRRRAAAVVGLAFVLALALGLLSLGGARTDRQTQVPASADRGRSAAPATIVGARDAAVRIGAHLPPLDAVLPAASGLVVVLLALGALAAAPQPGLAARPLPVRSGRGPPAR